MFRHLLRAEWTKLRSVHRWLLAMAAVVLLSVGFSLLVSAGGGTDANEHPDFVVGPNGRPVTDEFRFVHQSLSGDGSITVRVASQTNSHEWAGAGVMVKDGTTSGSRYAALMVTPKHGVRMSANFATDLSGGTRTTPRWLRLTRTGGTITGEESPDGGSWRRVGTVQLGELSPTVEVGMFVSSPQSIKVTRSAGGTAVTGQPTASTATFDNLRLNPAPVAPWRSDDVNQPASEDPKFGRQVETGTAEANGVFTVTGSGEIGPRESPDDMVQNSMFGVLIGLIVIAALGVLFMTAEFKRDMIRTTFAASPGRARVLAAKAVVLGGTAFVLGLVAGVASFLLGLPLLKSGGFKPPAYPTPSLTEASTLRAVVGTAVFVALVALLSLGLGAILRRSAGAITAALMLVILPVFVASALPATAGWLMRVTPAGGFAVQRAKPPSSELAEPWAMISPWAGFGVVAVYAAVALIGGAWLLRRRDT